MQASRTWNHRLHAKLLDIGFKRTYSDAGVYVYHQQGGDLILIVYVDDLLAAGPHLNVITDVHKSLASEFKMRDLGDVNVFLGIRFTRDRAKRTIELDQESYIESSLARFKMSDSSTRKTPLPGKVHITTAPEDYKASSTLTTEYQSIIGTLLYLMLCTRPDIAFAVNRLSRYMTNPTEEHLVLAKHILRYLRGTTTLRLRYDGMSQAGLIGYSDADWAEDKDNRISTTGYVFFMANAAVTCVSRRQRTVAKSSTQAEYQALSDACSELQWLRNLSEEIGVPHNGPIPLCSDNQGGIFLAVNPAHDRRLKYVDMHYHFIREYVAEDKVNIYYINTTEMVADVLTKPLDFPKHSKFATELGLHNPSI